MRLTHPNTFVGESDPDELWELYDMSGYFNLSESSSQEFEDRRRAFRYASEALSERPSTGAQITWESRDGIEASVSMIRPWSSAWLIYHLGRRRERALRLSGNRVLYELYLRAYEHAGRDRHLRWHVSYVQAEGARFSRILHREFVGRNIERGLAAIVPFRAWEVDCLGASVAPANVTVADTQDRKWMLKALAAQRPAPYLEAFDLVPGCLEIEAAKSEFHAAGLARERAVIVVRREGVARGAAVLDLAEEGLHLYGLLDVARVVALDDDFADHDLAALLAGASAWYRRQGKKRFVYFDELGRGASGVPARDLGAADQTMLSAELVPDLLEEVFLTTFSNPKV